LSGTKDCQTSKTMKVRIKMLRSHISTILLKIEPIHNWASDTRWVWFPFEFLRPNRDMLISSGRCCAMALCFGVYFGLFYLLRKTWSGVPLDFGTASQSFIYFFGFFFIWFNLVTAYFWNQRARRLLRKERMTDHL
jgi:hypothetical protein